MKHLKIILSLTYMVRASHGLRSGTRQKLKKGVREKFKPERYIQEFDIGEMVALKLEPASHKGMPHPRFKGRIGEIIEKRGRAYVIKIRDGNRYKKIISRPEHLKKI